MMHDNDTAFFAMIVIVALALISPLVQAFSPRASLHVLSPISVVRSSPSSLLVALAAATSAADSTTSSGNASTATVPGSRPKVTVQPYTWQKYKIHAEQCGPTNGQPVVLVHGFGCSTTYWRETATTLANAGYNVHAIDLLGQGKSNKPGDDVYYSINLWANQIDDYVRDVVSKQQQSGNNLFDSLLGKKNSDGIILMGNSLGSLVALAAAVGDHSELESANPDGTYLSGGKVKGICMFNCGVGLNSRGIVDEPQWSPFQRFLFKAVLNTLDAVLFNNPPVLNYVLNDLVTPELLRGALEGLYKYDPTRVDDELVMSFYTPAKEDGATDALRQIYTNYPGISPMQIHEKHSERVENLPIHLVWGDDDAVTPLSGGVGTFYSALAKDDSTTVTMDIIGGTGHIPFDDNPIESHESMLRWLKTL